MAEALRLADELDDVHTTHVARNAAAELRRLHAENERLRAQRDALLEFARYVADIDPGNPAPLFVNARAAIALAEGHVAAVEGAKT